MLVHLLLCSAREIGTAHPRCVSQLTVAYQRVGISRRRRGKCQSNDESGNATPGLCG